MTKVIACIDGSPAALAVCDAAAWAQQKLQAPLQLLHVLEKSESASQSDLSGNIGLGSREQLLKELAELDHQRSRLLLEQGRLMLDNAVQRVLSAGADADNTVTLQRHDSLLDTLAEFEGDTRLLVMGRQGVANSERRQSVGSHLENVSRTLHRPLLVTVGDFTPPSRFLLAYDGSATADKALEMVARSPLLKGAVCHLIHVGSCTARQREQLNSALQTLRENGFKVILSEQAGSEVVPSLLAYVAAEQIDLIIMGAWGHSRIRQFLVGSVTHEMLHKTPVPLLLLR